jgi:hypothetical protein
LPFKVSLARF